MTVMPPETTLRKRTARQRRLTFYLLILLVLLIICFFSISAYLYNAAPAYYTPRRMTAEQSEAAAQVAEQKLISVRNWAEHAHAIESARLHGIATAPIGPLQITATDSQLNGFFQKWKSLIHWDEKFDPYISDPTVSIIDGQIVLAGNLKDLHTILSLVFTARLDEQGRLVMHLQRILAGRLTLPGALWAGEQRRVTNAITDRLPRWRAEAKMDRAGAANQQAVSVAMSQLLFAALSSEPTEPVVFVPIDQKGGMPAKISKIEVGNGQITMTLDPMSAGERKQLWNSLRGEGNVAEY